MDLRFLVILCCAGVDFYCLLFVLLARLFNIR